LADFDLAIIGGGINGAGIARDAVGRGLSVLLIEQNDLASGTSSKSTKLIHGGLRYLEFHAFRLVREALIEREVLIGIAPHITRPLRFVLPHHAGLRPAWMLRLGLFLYDHLGGRKILPGTEAVDLTHHVVGQPLKREYRQGFIYSDGWVDDARLVVLNVVDAAERGAVIRTRTRLTRADRAGERWELVLNARGHRETVTARALVNAAGPWVPDAAAHLLRQHSSPHVRLIKGSHIIVPRVFEHDHAYIFQNADNRIVFAIPYERDFTLIGTTDLDFKGDPHGIKISEDETQYLLAAATEYFEKPVTWQDIVWTYAGVRPLFDDHASKAQEATRDYVLRTEGDAKTGAVVNVFGGKLTTHRRLSEEALGHIEKVLGRKGKPWTKGSKLPGGEFGPKEFDTQVERLNELYPSLPDRLLRRLARQFGTRAATLLGSAKRMEELGEMFGADLTQREVDYLVDNEWARTADDILWRRTKLGLRVGLGDKARLDTYLQGRLNKGKK